MGTIGCGHRCFRASQAHRACESPVGDARRVHHPDRDLLRGAHWAAVDPRVLLRLAIGVLIFVSVVAIEVRAILRSNRPVPRAWLSIGIIGPLFLVMFASI
jgi:hypothetical protein